MLGAVATRPVATEATAERRARDDGVEEVMLVPARDDSALAASTLHLGPATVTDAGDADADTLLFVIEGTGQLSSEGERHGVAGGTSALVVAGDDARLTAGPEGLAVLSLSITAEVDYHAPIGRRQAVVQLDEVEPGKATGSRSFQVLYGPHNGSTRATLFMGYIPPGRAPWHYHLYDEIVWIHRGRGALHHGEDVSPLAEGSAFRLRPRDVHIVENGQEHAELAVLGVFTPAGSPSAAYLEPGIAATYAFSD